MMRRSLASALLASLLVFAALAGPGCAKRHRIVIESNTCWISVIDKQSSAVTNDCGNATFRVAGEVRCVSVTNLNDTGYVRVRLDEGAWAESTAPKGIAETCR